MDKWEPPENSEFYGTARKAGDFVTVQAVIAPCEVCGKLLPQQIVGHHNGTPLCTDCTIWFAYFRGIESAQAWMFRLNQRVRHA